MSQVRSGARVLKPGHRGPAVQELKELLNEIGQRDANYGTPLVINEKFDRETLLKVTWFQRNYRQVYKRKIDGIVGSGTIHALDSVSQARLAPPPMGTRAPDTRPAPLATDPAAAIAPKKTNGALALTGSVGNRATNNPKDIRKVQTALVRHGYLKGSFTWERLDTPTKNAIKRFQQEQTRYKDCRVDRNGITARLLAQESLPKPVRYLGLSNPVGVLSPGTHVHGGDVLAVQERLVHHGFLSADGFEAGKNCEATIDAILKFQLTYTPYDDGRVDPAGMTSELLARNELPSARPGAYERLRAEFILPDPDPLFEQPGDRPTQRPVDTPKPAELVHTTDAAKTAWVKSGLARKEFRPNEPRTNINGQPMPPWFNAGRFVAEQKLTGARAALTGTMGKNPPKSPATHFIVHETDGRGFGHKGPHLYIGMDAGRYKLQNDFAKRSSGTKHESRHRRRLEQQGVQMVHVELETTHLKGNFPWPNDKQVYPDHQYKDLAAAYVMASQRAGRLLEVMPHREVDRGFSDGHSDPRDFDFNRFYSEVAKLLDLPAGTTFGYDPARDGTPTKSQPRGPGGLNYANPRLARNPSFPQNSYRPL